MGGALNFFNTITSISRNAHLWLPGYLLNRVTMGLEIELRSPIHIFFCICDHFEPTAEGVDRKKALERVRRWIKKYPEISEKYRDSTGYKPKYTFFYPIEEYKTEEMELLTNLCHDGYGEVELHLHHDNDTGENLRDTLVKFKNLMFSKHSLLSKDKGTGEVRYGFIHGNWALDNSKPDGRSCGVNNEIEILQETGCYADFTLPSVPDKTQTTKVNSIYYATDEPDRPKSHNWGTDAKTGRTGKGLLLIQGPLALDWERKKWGIFPGIENGNLNYENPVTAQRIKLWIESNIHVAGRPNYIFVKVHTHGCVEKNMERLLNRDLDFLFSHLCENYNDKESIFLHFVSTREIYNMIKVLENINSINSLEIDKYRDFTLQFNSQRNELITI